MIYVYELKILAYSRGKLNYHPSRKPLFFWGGGAAYVGGAITGGGGPW